MNLTRFSKQIEDAIYNATATGQPPVAVVLVRTPQGTSDMFSVQRTYDGGYVLTTSNGYFIAQGSLADIYPYVNHAGIVAIR